MTPHSQKTSNRVGSRKELLRRGFANNANLCFDLSLCLAEGSPRGDLEVAHLEVVSIGTDNVDPSIAKLARHLELDIRIGRHFADRTRFSGNGLGVAIPKTRTSEIRASATLRRRLVPNENDVGAQTLQLGVDLISSATTKRGHDHHRRDANEYSQGGQQAPHAMPDEGPHCHAERSEKKAHSRATNSCAAERGLCLRSLSIRPSRTVTTRPAQAAISGS